MTIDDKRFDFLIMVQTALLAQKPEAWLGFMGDALSISYRIPAQRSARDAALDVLKFINEEADLSWGLPLRE